MECSLTTLTTYGLGKRGQLTRVSFIASRNLNKVNERVCYVNQRMLS